MYEPLEQDEDKLHFDIIFYKAISDILNDPDTLVQLNKVDDQYGQLYCQIDSS